MTEEEYLEFQIRMKRGGLGNVNESLLLHRFEYVASSEHGHDQESPSEPRVEELPAKRGCDEDDEAGIFL